MIVQGSARRQSPTRSCLDGTDSAQSCDVTITAMVDATSQDAVSMDNLCKLKDFQRAVAVNSHLHVVAAVYANSTRRSTMRWAMDGVTAPRSVDDFLKRLHGGKPSADEKAAAHKLCDDILKIRRMIHDDVKISEWKGMRVFRCQALQPLDEVGGPAQSRRTKPRPADLTALLVENMRVHPGARHVVQISGHGESCQTLANMAVLKVAGALDRAARASGQPVDTVVNHSCGSVNLELLAAMPSSVHTVVGFASRFAGLTVTNNIVGRWSALPKLSDPAMDIGEQLLHQFSTESANILSRVDVRAFQTRVLPRLDEVGRELEKELESGAREARVALEADPIRLKYLFESYGYTLDDLSETDNKKRQMIERAFDAASQSGGGFLHSDRDLGSFLSAIARGEFHESTKRAAIEALTALKDCVRVKLSGPSENPYAEWAGVSFTSRPETDTDKPRSDSSRYDDFPLPSHWKSFIHQMNIPLP